MQRLKHRFGVALGDAKESAGGSFGPAVALLPVLQSAGTDANKSRELTLRETQFFPDDTGVRPSECRLASGLFFAAKDGAAFLETGDELLEEFVFHGYSD
jgi:hypothetical protein